MERLSIYVILISEIIYVNYNKLNFLKAEGF